MIGNLTAIGDALRRRRPEVVVALVDRYPELHNVLAQRRTLGVAPPGPPATGNLAAMELAKVAAQEARHDLDEVLLALGRRVRVLARLRLGSGAISSITTAGLVALILGSDRSAQVLAALLALGASMLGLVVVYLEDYSGGDGSTRGLRESMTAQVRALAEAEGRLKLALAQGDDGGILATLADINVVFAEVQFTRAQLGMKI